MTIRNAQIAVAIAAIVVIIAMLSMCARMPAKDKRAILGNTGYEVAVTFTPAATAAMKKLGQGATVEGFFYGAPVEAAKDKVDEDGHIPAGMDQVDIAANTQTVKMPGSGIDPDVMTHIASGKPSLMVRVYSSTTAGTPNQLDCTTFNGTLAAAQTAPVAIACDIR
ncbi:hypothetical protein MMA231_00819 [Asticcacaulis sp. MM231]|uniref:hypothetical protein n=1 Tax=Asticcacaulis sp. MM231 TaxID=3157666 RepID=UPI0032D59118